MAIAIDVAGTPITGNNITAITGIAVTIVDVASGSTIIVCTTAEDSSATDLVMLTADSSVDGSLTKDKEQIITSGNTSASSIWRLSNATAGTHVIVVKPTGTVSGMSAVAVSFTGVSNTGQPDAVTGSSATAEAEPYATDITTVAADCIVIDSIANSEFDDTMTPAGSQVEVMDNSDAGNQQKGAASYLITVGAAGAKTMQWGGWTGNATRLAHSLASYAPEAAAAAVRLSRLMTMGIG